jgi:hypothetical protein
MLSTFPPFALYGPALGMTTVVPAMDATRPAAVVPSRVVAAADRFGPPSCSAARGCSTRSAAATCACRPCDG